MASTSGTTYDANELPVPIPPQVEKMTSRMDMSTRSSKKSSTTKAERLARFHMEVQEILNQKERDIQELRNALHVEKLARQGAEDDVQEVVKRFNIVHDQKRAAVKEAETAKAQLRGYIDGLARAKREIKACQELIRVLEQQRNVAEEEAREARALAIELREEREVVIAREEGRRQGILEGITRARVIETTYESSSDDAPRTTDEDDVYDTETTHADTRRQSTASAPAVPVPQPERSYTPVYEPPPPAIPEGFISQAEPNSYIPVPPPHALSNAPPIPGAPPLGVIHEDSRESPLRVPPPMPRRAPSRRHSQADSASSTSISQFDILNNNQPSRSHSSHRPTSHYSQAQSHGQSQPYAMPMPPVPMAMPSMPMAMPAVPMSIPEPAHERTPQQPERELHHYASRTTLNMPLNSRGAGFDPESPTRRSRSPDDSDSVSNASDSTDGVTLNVEGPSRSASNSPPDVPTAYSQQGGDPVGHLLSAADAELRPPPVAPSPQSQPTPISDLPPGFVVSSFTPAGSNSGPLPSGSGSSSAPVIPSDEMLRQAEEEDSSTTTSTSSGMSGQSGLTTPPILRGKKPMKKASKKSMEHMTDRFMGLMDRGSPVVPAPHPASPVPPPPPVVMPTPAPTRGKAKGKRGKR